MRTTLLAASYLQSATETIPPGMASGLERVQDRLLEWVVHLPLVAVAGALVLLFAILGLWIARWDGLFRRVSPSPFVQNLTRQGVRAVLVLMGLLLALELLDATALVGAVLGTAGIMGLAVGFAFRDIVENYLAGVILSLRQPFAPNDHLVLEGHEGKVIRLTARETILMTLDGNHLRIPNATVFRSVILNYTANARRRFDFILSVGPEEDLLRAQEAGIEAMAATTGVLDDPPPSARIREVGDSWVTLRFFGWVDQQDADYGKVKSQAIRLVKTRLESEGIAMPPPEHLIRHVETPPPSEPAPAEAPVEVDVSPDESLDAQIEEDRRKSEEEDLLRDPEENPR